MQARRRSKRAGDGEAGRRMPPFSFRHVLFAIAVCTELARKLSGTAVTTF